MTTETRIDWYNPTEKQVQDLRDERKFIPHEAFNQVRKWSNTPTADFLLTRVNAGGAPVGRRVFHSRGRVPAGFRASQGCKFNCKRELGFTPTTEQMVFVGDYSILNPECQHKGEPYFTLMNLFEISASALDANTISLYLTAKKMAWFTHIEDDFPQPMKEILSMFGFQERELQRHSPRN